MCNNSINVYEAINNLGAKNGTDKFHSQKYICRSKGIASDHRNTVRDYVELNSLFYSDDQKSLIRINGTPIFRAYHDDGAHSNWFFHADDAKANFVEVHGMRDDIKFQQCFLDTRYITPNAFPMEVNIVSVKRGDNTVLGASINLRPEVSGYKFAKEKTFFADRSWEGVCEGPAIVSISREYPTYGFITGIMMNFGDVTIEELRAFCKKNPFVASRDIMVVDHPVRGKYFYFRSDRAGGKYCILRHRGKDVVFDRHYSDVVHADVEQYGSERIYLYKNGEGNE